MADPGLRSKFIEEQQAAARGDEFSRPQVRSLPYLDGLRLDRARILRHLQAARHPNYVRVLKSALADVETRLDGRRA